ncbi:hypothetical protein HWV62_821 [Athelia sp. TMB]|nr:hypothetical protein HWV62_821 [Athelia sp. TMB]
MGDSSLESTEQVLSTPFLSQVPPSMDSHIWGFLQPLSPALKRIDFWKSLSVYDIGRNPDVNIIILPGLKISAYGKKKKSTSPAAPPFHAQPHYTHAGSKHARISWDGQSNKHATVILQDLSSNGTFINGVKIEKGKSRIVRDGNELAFGFPLPQLENDGREDYRFVFRLVTAGLETEGIHAHYDIGAQLGAGGFACVYRAMHRQTGKWYALKIIKAAKIKASSQKRALEVRRATAFAREITILKRLVHPNICQFKEAFIHDSDDNISLVLELVDGGDLLDYILSRKGLSESSAKGITSQICEAMAYVHAKGIAHRDLKPENLLLTRDDPPIVKIADFGLAKVVDSLTAFRVRPLTNDFLFSPFMMIHLKTMCGTCSFIAPEVVNQNETEGYTHLVDSWSVGVIVFSM